VPVLSRGEINSKTGGKVKRRVKSNAIFLREGRAKKEGYLRIEAEL